MSQTRQLAAIMFTDIAGYTAMMQESETTALAVVRHYMDVLTKTIARYNGTILNDYGDGHLCSFSSATEALRCAIDMQFQFQSEPAVPLRIGLHIGEIFYEKGKVLGDGVNVTSRIQSLGVAHSILFSSEILSKIKNQPEFNTVSLGAFHFKNVDEPMEVFALVNDGLELPKRKEMIGKLKVQKGRIPHKNIIIAIVFISLLLTTFIVYRYFLTQKEFVARLPNSVIVLPFATQDSSQTYFAEGITVDVITELAKVKNISTLSWNTSLIYAHTSKPLKQIAGETGVSYVLTGIIQRDKQNIRVNVALVSPENGKSLWTQSWDQELQFIFEIQKQIAQDVANELDVKLSMGERAKLDRYSTRNFEAYDLFLKARAESRKFQVDPVFIHRSNQLLEKALIIDPDFPQALTLRATNQIDLTWTEGRDPLKESTNIKEDIHKSLILDPDYSDAYFALGTVNYYLEWDFKEAKKNFEKGWELSNYGEVPTAQCFCGFVEFAITTGDYLGALSYINNIEKVDPGYPYGAGEKILIYSILQDSLSMRKILEEPSIPDPAIFVAQYELGYYNDAIKGILKNSLLSTDYTSYLASAYFKIGFVKKSDSIVNQLIQRSFHERNIDFALARIFSVRGNKEKALYWYKSAYLKHDCWIVYSLIYSDLRLIINEPEVQKILKYIGILNDSA